jgi:hypothetical protein
MNCLFPERLCFLAEWLSFLKLLNRYYFFSVYYGAGLKVLLKLSRKNWAVFGWKWKLNLNRHYTTQHYFSRELNSTFFIDFQLLITTPYLVFSQHVRFPEIILNESSKNTDNVLIEWLQKDTTKYFLKPKVYTWFLW